VLLTRDGRRARLQVIHQRYEEQFRVVNLTIAEHHTFAVGAAAILVHNTSGCGHVGTSAPNSVARTNPELVEEIGTRAQRWAKRKGLTGTPRQIGAKQHKYARDLLERYQSRFGQRGLQTEVSFKNGKVVRYGKKGSVRADVFDPATGEIWDYKFGTTPMSQRQFNRLLQHVDGVTSVTPIYRP